MTPPIQRFSDFWPYYLSQHRHPACRLLHFVGTTAFIGIDAWALIVQPVGMLWWLLIAPVVAYGCAWVGHLLIEGNRPATFGHPLWSLLADFRMYGWMLTGRLWTGDLADRVPQPAD